jgi:hypothetical protein
MRWQKSVNYDTNSVVALVQKYGMMLEKYQINAVCIPAEY